MSRKGTVNYDQECSSTRSNDSLLHTEIGSFVITYEWILSIGFLWCYFLLHNSAFAVKSNLALQSIRYSELFTHKIFSKKYKNLDQIVKMPGAIVFLYSPLQIYESELTDHGRSP